MKTYIVITETVTFEKFIVQAENEDDACEKVLSGDEMSVELDYGDVYINEVYERKE
jgi:hypothetical protein